MDIVDLGSVLSYSKVHLFLVLKYGLHAWQVKLGSELLKNICQALVPLFGKAYE